MPADIDPKTVPYAASLLPVLGMVFVDPEPAAALCSTTPKGSRAGLA